MTSLCAEPRRRSFVGPGLCPGPRPQGLATSLDVEIGAGAGMHAIARALACPHRQLVAIERTKTRFSKLMTRYQAHHRPSNLKLVNEDAVAWIYHWLRPQQVERFFILYPNPYPKRSQSNKRWHFMPFLDVLTSKLRPGGTLHLATNQEFYAQEAWQAFPRRGHLKRKSFGMITSASTIPRTHFEKKYLARGERCFDLVFEK